MKNNKKLFRIDFTDFEWFEKMRNLGENLPSEYCDIFDRDGEISEDYSDIMNIDIYIIDKKTKKIVTFKN